MSAERIKNTYFILGPDRPEMRDIERVLKDQGANYGYGAFYVGKSTEMRRVLLRAAEGVLPVTGNYEDFSSVVMLNCNLPICTAPTIIEFSSRFARYYNQNPSQYWEESMIGRVYDYLGLEATKEARLTVALADCPHAGLIGMCPGITPEELLEFHGTRDALPDLKVALEETKRALKEVPVAEIGGVEVKCWPTTQTASEVPLKSICFLGVPTTGTITSPDSQTEIEYLIAAGDEDIMAAWCWNAKNRGLTIYQVINPAIYASACRPQQATLRYLDRGRLK